MSGNVSFFFSQDIGTYVDGLLVYRIETPLMRFAAFTL